MSLPAIYGTTAKTVPATVPYLAAEPDAVARWRARLGDHGFRVTWITAYLKNKGTLETAQIIANHESPRTTKLYDRRQDEISLDEVERIAI